jgi:hypothetical protein
MEDRVERFIALAPQLKAVYCSENGFGSCPHTDVVRKVHPTDGAGRIHDEFGGSRDIFSAFAAGGVQHSVLANDVGVGVG